MMAQVLIPDMNEAQRFLDLLEPGGTYWFQTALEPKPENGNASPRVLHGTLARVGEELARLNQNGSAVWVQINAGTGRKDSDVNRVRAYFVDQDKGSTELLFSSAQPADILVESSHGKFHGYWLTGNAPLKSFAQRMHALADKFDGDHNICNLGRVMRLPGFIHHKGEQFMSRIAKIREEL
jgi:hypothetical protein